MYPDRHQLAEQYQELLADIYQGCTETAACALPPEMQVQSWWAAGLLPDAGETHRHGGVRLLERGRWNRLPGPDFTHAEIELDGKRLRGDIEIDPRAQDWEAHGHGANPAFDKVILHIVLTPPPAGWYTRNSQHREIPVLYLPPECWQHIIQGTAEKADTSIPRCRQPLAKHGAQSIICLLKAAAAYRQKQKRCAFHKRAAEAGTPQAWYEAWASTLGYSANKEAMRILAMRAPLSALKGQEEAILLGTAGFLLPVLPGRAGEDARTYHRQVWDAWWILREQFELSAERGIDWSKAPSRPLNHPQRRVAALAATAARWSRLLPLLHAGGTTELRQVFTSISHPFWDTHYTLASAPMHKKTALIGNQRVDDFLINHVYAYDESTAAWESYIACRITSLPESIKHTAALLFGERADLQKTLKYAYAQQALLQIDADFCACNICQDCAFPVQLSQWM